MIDQLTGRLHIGGAESRNMSELMAVLIVDGEKFICVDYDRPIWYSKIDASLKVVPCLDNFVVDGILGVASQKFLKTYRINKRFNSIDFEQVNPSSELQAARKILYDADKLNIEYFHDFDGDIQIHKDLARFKMPLISVNKVSTPELSNLSN